MKFFYVLTIFISLSLIGVGVYFLVDAVTDWNPTYFAMAQIFVGAAFVLTGAALLGAIAIAALSERLTKHRMKKRGGKK